MSRSNAGTRAGGRRDVVLLVIVGWLAGAVGTLVASTIQAMLDSWSYGLPLYVPWPGDIALFGVHPVTAWLVGGVGVSALASMLMTTLWQRPEVLRILALLAAAACIVIAGLTIAFKPAEAGVPAWHLLTLGAGAVGGAVIATRRTLPSYAPRTRSAIIVLTLTGSVALGISTLREAHREYRGQELPAFTLELVAAYPVGERTVVTPDMETAEYGGRSYVIQRDNRLQIRSSDVRRVRWVDDAIWIRFGDDAARAVATRSWRRVGQHDALFVDGRLVIVPTYKSAVMDRLAISHPEGPNELRVLYERLTRP